MMRSRTKAALVGCVAVTLAAVGFVFVGPAAADEEPRVALVELVRQKVLVKEIAAPPQQLQAKIRKAVTDATNAARRQGLDIAGPPVVRYLERKPERFVVEAGIPVQGAPRARPGMRVIELPAGSAATATHVGVYEDLPETHAAIDRWLAAKKRKPSGKRWEVFVSNPVLVRDPAKRETKVFVPVE